jgi:glycosyltransferase involved in cell wall biosynthesis
LRPRPLSILLFSSFENLGQGGQESLFLLASRLNRDLFRPVVLVPKRGSLADKLDEASIDVVVLDLPPILPVNISRIIRAQRKLWCVVERYGIDLLHSDGPRNTFYAGMLGRLKRRPVVWHVRSSERDPYDRLLCILSSKIVLVADALAFRFPAESQKARCVTIHNGVDLQRYAPLTHSSLKPHSPYFKSQSIIIVHTGRVEPQKGQKQLIEACGRLHDQVPALRMVFAGEIKDGAYFQECLQCADSLGVRERIRFIGHCEDVGELLQAGDIFVLPSTRGEAFSRSILEAMAVGKPVVATSCGGAAEAIIHNSSGFIVPPEDSAALAEKIALLATREELRNQMGRAARIRAETFFGIEKNVERTVRVYEEVLRSH